MESILAMAMRAGAALVLSAAQAQAGSRPRIEIHAMVDCAAADGVGPAADSQCPARGALVAASEITGIGHVRFGRGQDMLVVAMNEASRRRFYDYMRAHAAKPAAVLVDGRMVGRPVLSEPMQPASLEFPGLTGPQIDALVSRFRGPARGGR